MVQVWAGGQSPGPTGRDDDPERGESRGNGGTVIFAAAASGGSGRYEYKLPARAGRGAELVRGYSTSASWSWNTQDWRPGTYQMAVLARNVGSTKSYEVYRTNYVWSHRRRP